MITTLRWIFALPAGVIAAFLAHLLCVLAFGIGHGFDTIFDFYEATDMAGMPISGTYVLFVSRAVPAGVFLYTTIFVLPKYKKQIAVALAGVTIILLAGAGVYLAVKLYLFLSIGVWYRLILEFVSRCLGVIIGARAIDETKKRAETSRRVNRE